MPNSEPQRRSKWQLVGDSALGILMTLLGLALAWGGFRLLSLGGSPYYILAGLVLLATAWLLFRGNRWAGWLYAAFLIATVCWSMAEVAFDGWALMPRLIAPFVVGLLFLPLAARHRRRHGARSFPLNGAGFVAGLAAATIAGWAINAAGPPAPADPIYQTGRGSAPAPTIRPQTVPAVAENGDWPSYSNDTGGSRFSPLAQLTPANVAKLEPIWTYRTGLGSAGQSGSLETTPLKIGDLVYLCNSSSDVVALDAETGQQVWRYQAHANAKGVAMATCRGVTYYRVPGVTGECAERIFAPSIDGMMVGLDAHSGRLCQDFGQGGRVNLREGLGEVLNGQYYVTSAIALIRGKLVFGGWVRDGQYWGAPSGVIRAIDAKTGAFAWAFDIGRPDEHGMPAPGETFTRSIPNSWAPISVDEELGLVYLPTGNPIMDYYGGLRRPFDEKFSDSVIALDGETGALRWSFQTLHHDLWAYDVASQPTLVDINVGGQMRQALIQPTKRGEMFVLDRVTGQPILPVAEKPVPQGGIVPGERLARTQPFSVGMPSFRGPYLRERDMWGITPLDQLYCRIQFKSARYEGTLTPPGFKTTISQPGTLGGSNWGGVSIDRDRNIMIVNSNRILNATRLITRAAADAGEKKSSRLRGSGEHGSAAADGGKPKENGPYATGGSPFLSPLMTPCTRPPFGVITAVDLTTQKVVWSKPLGTMQDSGPLLIKSRLPITMGVPNIGGSIATRGGLVFIGASQENSFRAFDVTNGKELWKARLPAGAHATPSTYWSRKSGRQVVVVAAGGSVPMLSGRSDTIVAYALPRDLARGGGPRPAPAGSGVPPQR